MVLGIVGSRKLSFQQTEGYIKEAIKEYKPSSIVSGAAEGTDSHAKRIAIEQNIQYIEYRPDYHRYLNLAPFERNTKIAKEADVILCLFLHRIEGGTKDTLKKSRAMNKKTIVYIIDEIELNLF